MFPLLRTTFPAAQFVAPTAHPLDTLFDRVLGHDGGAQFGESRWNAGPLAVWQDENTIHVEAELPGVAENDVEITVHNDELKIVAERRAEEGRKYLYNGRAFGRFERSVALPEMVDSEKVEATLSQGILRISLPKHPDTRPKKISLKSS